MIRFVYKIVSRRGNIINNEEQCIHCGLCEKTCKFHAISIDKKQKKWNIDHTQCMRCQHCIEKCPRHSLQLIKHEKQ